MLDPKSPLPLYYQMKEFLLEEIRSGKWSAGEKIPSETQLCKTCGVSRNTAQKAIEELVQEGVLSRRQGLGTFVTTPRLEQGLMNFYSFYETMKAKGIISSVKVLLLTEEPATQHNAAMLGIEAGDMLTKLVRVRYADGAPIMLDTSHIPCALAPGLVHMDLEHRSLYTTLFQDYKIQVVKAREVFEPVVTQEWESKWLEVEPGSPAILLDRVAYASNDITVEYCRSIVAGDKCRFYTELR